MRPTSALRILNLAIAMITILNAMDTRNEFPALDTILDLLETIRDVLEGRNADISQKL